MGNGCINKMSPGHRHVVLSPCISSSGALRFRVRNCGHDGPSSRHGPRDLSIEKYHRVFRNTCVYAIGRTIRGLICSFRLLLSVTGDSLFSRSCQTFLGERLGGTVGYVSFRSRRLAKVTSTRGCISRIVCTGSGCENGNSITLVTRSRLSVTCC